ncbi:MAG TPA: type ISP restriction/modification enzyme, partial [Methylomirabilota bacterium]|nr:type ISP restriction/modification enzyme [Methylomirabilota bacterium]
EPQSPFYLFTPQNTSLKPEYERGWKITEIFVSNAVGFQTHRDYFVISPLKEELLSRIQDFINPRNSDEEVRERYFSHIAVGKYPSGDTSDWSLSHSRKELQKINDLSAWITKCIRRPFDFQWYFFHPAAVDRGRPTITNQMINHNNKALLWTRPMSPKYDFSVLCASCAVDQSVVGNKVAGAGGTYVGPLYLYPDVTNRTLFSDYEVTNAQEGRRPNLSPVFISDISNKLNIQFIQDGKGDLQHTVGPEDIFNYIYAVFHSLTYRERYAEFLKGDFPYLPLTSNIDLFRELCRLGDRLVGLHLMEKSGSITITYPELGNNVVEKVDYAQPADEPEQSRVWINKAQYFDGVPPEIWEFHIGGYQVCQKWLKDRKGRALSFDDIKHYQRIVAALAETIYLMEEIDETIEMGGGWPIE